MDKKQLFLNTLSWGLFLWFFGYVFGMVLFPFVPANAIGWVIAPVGTLVMIWVLVKKIHREKFGCYIGLGVVWLLLAVVLDWLFIIKLLKPVGYYKADVYTYYALTLLVPIAVGWWKKQTAQLSMSRSK